MVVWMFESEMKVRFYMMAGKKTMLWIFKEEEECLILLLFLSHSRGFFFLMNEKGSHPFIQKLERDPSGKTRTCGCNGVVL